MSSLSAAAHARSEATTSRHCTRRSSGSARSTGCRGSDRLVRHGNRAFASVASAHFETMTRNTLDVSAVPVAQRMWVLVLVAVITTVLTGPLLAAVGREDPADVPSVGLEPTRRPF